MAEEFNMDAAKQVLDSGIDKAKAILDDPAQMDDLLTEIKAKAADLPAMAGSALANLPLMASMVKSYITKEYTAVSPKVVASVVAAFLYLVKGRDIIPDSLPLVGLVDDVAVVALAMKLNEPELEAYRTWQETGVLPAEA